MQLRTDGVAVDIDGDYTETLARIDSNPKAIGVFGLSFYENNTDKLKVATMDGVTPSTETIASGEYPVSRPLYFYVKKAHIGVIPGLKEYAAVLRLRPDRRPGRPARRATAWCRTRSSRRPRQTVENGAADGADQLIGPARMTERPRRPGPRSCRSAGRRVRSARRTGTLHERRLWLAAVTDRCCVLRSASCPSRSHRRADAAVAAATRGGCIPACLLRHQRASSSPRSPAAAARSPSGCSRSPWSIERALSRRSCSPTLLDDAQAREPGDERCPPGRRGPRHRDRRRAR